MSKRSTTEGGKKQMEMAVVVRKRQRIKLPKGLMDYGISIKLSRNMDNWIAQKFIWSASHLLNISSCWFRSETLFVWGMTLQLLFSIGLKFAFSIIYLNEDCRRHYQKIDSPGQQLSSALWSEDSWGTFQGWGFGMESTSINYSIFTNLSLSILIMYIQYCIYRKSCIPPFDVSVLQSWH